MPQITLVPWNAWEYQEFANPWAFAGNPAFLYRAVGDGNHGASTIFLGTNDSNSIRGNQWRVEGTGAMPSWANKTITSVKLDVSITNSDASSGGMVSFNFVIGNDPLSWNASLFLGDKFSPVNAPTWHTLLNSAHDLIRDALLADNFLIAFIHFNHGYDLQVVVLEAARLIVTYNDNLPNSFVLPEV